MDENEANIVNINVSMPFADDRTAEIVYNVLRVDAEPRRSQVQKHLTVDKNVVNARFTGATAKQVKIASDNYFKNILLVLETIQFTGPPKSKEYNYFY